MIYYLEQYDDSLNEEQAIQSEEKEVQKLFEKAATASEFKGFSVILKPLANLSYVDILP